MSRQKIEVFKDRKGEFRWRLVSSRRVIATSGEGYTKKAGAIQGVRSVTKALSGGTLTAIQIPVVDLTIKLTKAAATTRKTSPAKKASPKRKARAKGT